MQEPNTAPLARALRALRAPQVGYLIVASPFVYALHWVALRLEPIEMVDAFPYLWRAPISWAYFTGRSLTQRVLYSLSGEDPRTIAVMQLGCAALTGIGAYALLSERARPARNLAIAATIALLSTSFSTTFATIALVPEPLFLYGSIAFPLVVVFSRGASRAPLLFGVGVLAILSKSTAPAVVIVEIATYGAVRFTRTTAWPAIRHRAVWPFAALVGLACLSMFVSRRWDTSIELNAANDIFRRVLPDSPVVQHYHLRHAMPESPAIQALSGQYANYKLGGRPIYRVNERTRNYELVPGTDPFLRWVATEGFGHYVRHLLLHDPVGTWKTLDHALANLFAPSTVGMMSRETQSHAVLRSAAQRNAKLLHGPRYDPGPFDENYYLDAYPDVAAAVRRGALASGFQHYERFGRAEGRLAGWGDSGNALPEGLFRFDPIAALTSAFAIARLNRLFVLFALILTSGYAARRFPENRGFAFAVVLLTGSLAGFFLGYFGDAMDIERHVWTPVITLTLGFSVLVTATADFVVTPMMTRRTNAPSA